MTGRLATEASAYLRQHADNPVDWWSFSDAAFEQARLRDVPVFISIGYAACHWCHVMAHESFEDSSTADQLNEHFISIKVDREERPDVDAVYMAATQAMTGQGGWPMSVFAFPDGRAFYAGTYFPPRPARGQPAFRQVLDAIQDAWTTRRPELEASAEALASNLGDAQQRNHALLSGPAGLAPEQAVDTAGDALKSAVRALLEQEDPRHGGFGDAPKFPPSTVLPFLLRYAAGGTRSAAGGKRSAAGGPTGASMDPANDDDGALAHAAGELAARTLETMATSGFYDQLDGGFSRYTVDAAWALPHFEKMLYDNVLLLRTYAQFSVAAHREDQRLLAVDVTRRTAAWMIRRLQVDGGAFASSLDADTTMAGKAVEGGTYVWTEAQLVDALGTADGAAAARLFDLTAGRTESGGSTLHPGRLWSSGERELWDRLRPALLLDRDRRQQPARDDKVVASWNGLAVAALADAGALLGDAELIGAATRAAQYLYRVHRVEGVLYRVSHGGKAVGIEGLLEDYAGCAEGFFALYAATGDERWYAAAEELTQLMDVRFFNDGVLRDTAVSSGQLIRAQANQSAADPLDGPTPSGTALYAGVLTTYAAYSGLEGPRRRAAELRQHAYVLASRAPRAVGWSLAVAQSVEDGPRELAVVGQNAEAVRKLARQARAAAGPSLVVAMRVTTSLGAALPGARPEAVPGAMPQALPEALPGALPQDLPESLPGALPQDLPEVDSSEDSVVPLLRGRTAGDGLRAYLCRGMVCSAPVSTFEELRDQLRAR